jgi:peptidoglycan hydrolase CwlO-like protein
MTAWGILGAMGGVRQGGWLAALLVALLLCLPLGAQQDKTQQRQQLQRELQSLQGEIGKLRGAIDQKRREERKVRRDLAELDQQITRVSARLRETRNRLARARKEQAELAKRLEMLTQRLRRRESLLAQRLRAAYKYRSVSYLSLLTNARNLSELNSRSYVLRQIVKTDRELLEQVRADQQEVAQAKAQMDALVRRIAGLEADLRAQQAELTDAQDEKQALLKDIARERALYEKQLAELEAESQAIARRLRALMETPKGRARADRPGRDASSALWTAGSPLASACACIPSSRCARCTPASTSPRRQARLSAPPTRAWWSKRATFAAMATRSSSITAAAWRPCTRTAPRCWCRQVKRSSGGKSSPASAAQATPQDRTCTSKCASTASL